MSWKTIGNNRDFNCSKFMCYFMELIITLEIAIKASLAEIEVVACEAVIAHATNLLLARVAHHVWVAVGMLASVVGYVKLRCRGRLHGSLVARKVRPHRCGSLGGEAWWDDRLLMPGLVVHKDDGPGCRNTS